jgi:metal-responsive CopG/Arc/MetJ family transcriptional regulator
MKGAERMNKTNKTTERITISLPGELYARMVARIEKEQESDPELDQSKFIRRLIRQDLEGIKQPALIE